MSSWIPFAVAFSPATLNADGGDNCGTGAGGFKKGNKCRTGGGAGKKAGGSGEPAGRSLGITKEGPDKEALFPESKKGAVRQLATDIRDGMAQSWEAALDHPILMLGFGAIAYFTPPAISAIFLGVMGATAAAYIHKKVYSRAPARNEGSNLDEEHLHAFAEDIVAAIHRLTRAAGLTSKGPTVEQVKEFIIARL